MDRTQEHGHHFLQDRRVHASRSSLCTSSLLKGENTGPFSPGCQASLYSVPRMAGHHLAARHLLEKLLLPEVVRGSGDEPMQRAIEISLTSGIICPFTSYVGVRTSRRAPWYHGPLALLSPRQSFVPCKILLLRGSLTDTSCFPKTIWNPPRWHTAVQESRIAIKRLTNGIANLLQHGAHKEGTKL